LSGLGGGANEINGGRRAGGYCCDGNYVHAGERERANASGVLAVPLVEVIRRAYRIG